MTQAIDREKEQSLLQKLDETAVEECGICSYEMAAVLAKMVEDEREERNHKLAEALRELETVLKKVDPKNTFEEKFHELAEGGVVDIMHMAKVLAMKRGLAQVYKAASSVLEMLNDMDRIDIMKERMAQIAQKISRKRGLAQAFGEALATLKKVDEEENSDSDSEEEEEEEEETTNA
jgi:hypothetical protein